jgi:beta-glucanase (GH16 family)
MTYEADLAAVGKNIDAALKTKDDQIAALKLQISAATGPQPILNQGTEAVGYAWRKKWEDTFYIPGTVDPAMWSTGRWANTTVADEPWNKGKEGAYMASSQVAVVADACTITTKPAPKVINGVSYPTASGFIRSKGAFVFEPGDYIEARIQVPKESNCWPAMWFLPLPINTWPPEMDGFEIDTRKNGTPMFNYHMSPTSKTGPTPYGGNVDCRGAYHIFGVHWNKNGVLVPYLDGEEWYVPQGLVEPRPMYLLINLSTFAGPQPPAGTQMKIDWVNVWSL